MANWSSLKPLKTQSTILTIVALVLVAILIFTPRHAFRIGQSNLFTTDSESRSIVNSTSGLSIRNEPKKNSKLLITAPYQAKLNIIETDVAQDFINGKSGYWYKVEYRGITGFAFGNYIDK